MNGKENRLVEIDLQEGWMAVIQISRRVAWFPILIFAVHEVAAHGFDFYNKWPPFDIPMHFLGGVAIAYFIAGSLQILADRKLIEISDPLVFMALTLSLTCTATICWELAEWTSDRLVHTSCQLSLNDTLADIVIGLGGGGLLTGCWARRNGRIRLIAPARQSAVLLQAEQEA